jgi:hypothetical protein
MDGSEHDRRVHDERKVPNIVEIIFQFSEGILDVGAVRVVDLGLVGLRKLDHLNG